jgi:large subunit ribosomal protein L31
VRNGLDETNCKFPRRSGEIRLEYQSPRCVLTIDSQEGENVKTGIHPETTLGTVTCSTCGTSFASRSTAGDMKVETCSRCHPAYTGRTAKVATGSRIERFERRREAGQAHGRKR